MCRGSPGRWRIRSCIVGELATNYYARDIYPGDVHIAIADEQLEAARYMLLEKAFIEVPQKLIRFDCPSEAPRVGPNIRLSLAQMTHCFLEL